MKKAQRRQRKVDRKRRRQENGKAAAESAKQRPSDYSAPENDSDPSWASYGEELPAPGKNYRARVADRMSKFTERESKDLKTVQSLFFDNIQLFNSLMPPRPGFSLEAMQGSIVGQSLAATETDIKEYLEGKVFGDRRFKFMVWVMDAILTPFLMTSEQEARGQF